MTPKKKKFARLVAQGMPPDAAIISAGYSPSTPTDRIKKMLDDPAVQALIQREKEKPTPKEFETAEDFMHWLMNDQDESTPMRWKAANSLLMSSKSKAPGKKEQKMEKARALTGKFGAIAPPKPKFKH